MNIYTNIRDLSIDDLDLPTRIANALIKNSVRTIGDITNYGSSYILNIRNIGKKSSHYFAKKVFELITKSGFIPKSDIEIFMGMQAPHQITIDRVEQLLRLLPEESSPQKTSQIHKIKNAEEPSKSDVRDSKISEQKEITKRKNVLPIESLHLPTRLENALTKHNILYCDELVTYKPEQISHINQIGVKSLDVIRDSIIEYLQKEGYIYSCDGVSSMGDYLNLLHKYIANLNTESVQDNAINANYIFDINEYINKLYNQINNLSLSDKEQLILKYRLRFYPQDLNHAEYTLEEIGKLPLMNVTRERIRQIEKKLLLKFKKCLFRSNQIKTYEHIAFSKIFEEALNQKIAIKWPEGLRDILAECGVRTHVLSVKFFEFYFESRLINTQQNLFEYKNNIYLVYADKLYMDHIHEEFNLLINFLNKQHNIKFSSANMAIFLGIKDNWYENELMHFYSKVIETISDYRVANDGFYYRNSLTRYDMIYYLLKKANKPLHYKEITQIINSTYSKNYSEHTIQAALTNKYSYSIDHGYYALAEWGLKKCNRIRYDDEWSVESLVREYLKREPNATVSQAIKYVKERRHASHYTISQSYSNIKKELNPSQGANQVTAYELLKHVLASHKSYTVDELYNILNNVHKCSKSTIRQYLGKMGVRSVHGRYSL